MDVWSSSYAHLQLLIYTWTFLLYLSIGSVLELLVLKNAAECTSQRLKWTSGARVMIIFDLCSFERPSVQASKRSSVQASNRSSVQTNVQTFKRPSVQTFKHSSVQAFKRSSVQAFKRSQTYSLKQWKGSIIQGSNFNFPELFGGFEFRILDSLKNYLRGSNFELRILAGFICRIFGFRIIFERNYDRTCSLFQGVLIDGS